ncbi:MAG TPA: hypothetical protein VFW90_01875 [Candidatus Saccharimonadales bacterium]|nr:hypothetical protein [Candidatus Saccharimonadales bacterium]
MLNRKPTVKDQTGVVSLLVVSILAVILALVSLGFSKLMDRELRQSVDRELSAQAYFSAESGLNDARTYLKDNMGGSIAGCGTGGATQFVNNGDLSNGTGAARYSCVNIDSTPNELVYSIQAGQSVTIEIDQATLNRLYLGWENQTYTGAPRGLGALGTFPREDAIGTNNTGILRVGLYPVPRTMPGAISSTNDFLTFLSRNYFMYPNCLNADCSRGSPGWVDYNNNASNGSSIPGNCNSAQPVPINNSQATPRFCNTYIYDLNGGNNRYYLRLTALYAPLNVSIQSTNDSNTNPIPYSEIQGIVDVTGTGSDVLQRIRARVNLRDQYNAPSYGIQSMQAICKGFRVYVDSPRSYGGIESPGASGFPNGDNACNSPDGGGSIGSIAGDTGPGSSRACPVPYTGNLPNCTYPVPTPTLSASPNPINQGSSTNLTWSSSNTYDSCTGYGQGFNTGGATSGTDSSGALSAGTYSYYVHCDGFGGSKDSNTVTVTVRQPCQGSYSTGSFEPNCGCRYSGSYPNCQGPPPPDCSDYSLSVGFTSASVGGSNPCGIGIAQCNAFNSGGGSIAQIFSHGGSYPTSVNYSPPPGTAYVTCWSTDGRSSSS